MLLLEKDWDALKQLVSGSLDKSIFDIIDETVRLDKALNCYSYSRTRHFYQSKASSHTLFDNLSEKGE